MVPGGDLISSCLWSLGFTCIRKHWLDVLVRNSFPGLLGTLFLQKDVSRDHWEHHIALLNSHCSCMGTHSPPGHPWQHRDVLQWHRVSVPRKSTPSASSHRFHNPLSDYLHTVQRIWIHQSHFGASLSA